MARDDRQGLGNADHAGHSKGGRLRYRARRRVPSETSNERSSSTAAISPSRRWRSPRDHPPVSRSRRRQPQARKADPAALLDEGLILFAASNEREAASPRSSSAQGASTPDSAREADARQAREGLRLGQVLLQMGVVTPEKLNDAIAGQIREILWGASTGIRAKWSSRSGPRRSADVVRMDIPIPEVSSKESAGLPTSAASFSGSVTATTLREDFGPPLSFFDRRGTRYYDAVDGKTTLRGSAPGPRAGRKTRACSTRSSASGSCASARSRAPARRRSVQDGRRKASVESSRIIGRHADLRVRLPVLREEDGSDPEGRREAPEDLLALRREVEEGLLRAGHPVQGKRLLHHRLRPRSGTREERESELRRAIEDARRRIEESKPRPRPKSGEVEEREESRRRSDEGSRTRSPTRTRKDHRKGS